MKNRVIWLLCLFLAWSSGCKKTPLPPSNSNPYISGIQATPGRVGKGGAIEFSCVAIDPDNILDPSGKLLNYDWSSDGGSFFMDSLLSQAGSEGNPVFWKAPDSSGVFTISVRVRDESGGESNSNRVTFVGSFKFERVIGSGTLNQPMGITVDPGGDIFIADPGNDRAYQFSNSGALISDWSFTGVVDTLVDTIPVPDETTYTNRTFESPVGIAVDELNNFFYILDNDLNEVYRFRAPTDTAYDSTYTAVSGSGKILIAGATMNGYLYVVNGTPNRIVRYDTLGNKINSTGSSIAGDAKGIAVNPLTGEVYVSVFNTNTSKGWIEKYDAGLSYDTTWTDSIFAPTGIAVGPDGSIFVSQGSEVLNQYHRIVHLSPSGGFLSQWGEVGGEDEQFNNPFGITVDGNGWVYVCDLGNGSVKVYSP